MSVSQSVTVADVAAVAANKRVGEIEEKSQTMLCTFVHRSKQSKTSSPRQDREDFLSTLCARPR